MGKKEDKSDYSLRMNNANFLALEMITEPQCKAFFNSLSYTCT